MTDRQPDDIDDLAAEYVLGTLDGAVRAAVARRRLTETELDRAIGEWEARLAPLMDAVAPVAPDVRLKQAVLNQIIDRVPTPPANTVVALETRLKRWRAAAIGFGAMAAGLAGTMIARPVLPQPPSRTIVSSAPAPTYVAVLQKDAQSPAFLMTVDIEKQTFTVRPLSAERHAGKSYELWLVHEKVGPPRSLGVVADQGFTVAPRLAPFDRAEIREATYAVSLEPEGGSPSGLPTGPVVFAGKLVQSLP